MGKIVWVVYYRSTDEDFGYSFDGVYVFQNEGTAHEAARKLYKHNDYVMVSPCKIIDKIPETI